MILGLLYLAGAILSMVVTWRILGKEFGPPNDFGDFGTMVYMTVGAGVVWPVFAVIYLLWLMYKGSRKEEVG